MRGITEAVVEKGGRVRVNRVGSMLTLFFIEQPVTDFAIAKTCDTDRFCEFHQAMLRKGVYWPPSQFEAAFLSTAHTEADIDHTVEAIGESL